MDRSVLENSPMTFSQEELIRQWIDIGVQAGSFIEKLDTGYRDRLLLELRDLTFHVKEAVTRNSNGMPLAGGRV